MYVCIYIYVSLFIYNITWAVTFIPMPMPKTICLTFP